MRKLFISEVMAKSALQAAEIAPWSESILRVDNGWMAFDSYKSMNEFREEQEEYAEWRKHCCDDRGVTLRIVGDAV